MDLPKRKQIRLEEYDYWNNGAYYITICTYNREQLFGKEIIMSILSEMSKITRKYGNISMKTRLTGK